MGIFLTLIVGLVLWVVLWGTSLMKSFDAFLIGMLLVLLAATVAHRRGRTCPAATIKPRVSARVKAPSVRPLRTSAATAV